MNNYAVLGGASLRLDPHLLAARQNKQTPLRAAFSSAVSMRTPINRRSGLSPDTACDTFTTVARSNRSTGVPIVRSDPSCAGGGRCQIWILQIHLPHLAVGAPTKVTGPGVRKYALLNASNPRAA